MQKIKSLLHKDKSDSSSTRSSTSDRSPRTSTANDATSSPTYSSRNTRPSTDSTARTSLSTRNGGNSLEGNRKDAVAADGIATDGLTNGDATTHSRTTADRDLATTQDNTTGNGIANGTSNGIANGTSNGIANETSNGIPANESRLEREEAVDDGRTQGRTGGMFSGPHKEGHVRDHKFDLGAAEHTHEHVAPVTHERVHRHETEEVAREREHERHIHHVQHHVQPVHDKEIRDEVHHHNKVAPTRIHEHHANTKEDTAAFESLGARHKDSVTEGNQTREVVDLGETVRTHEHHHVHNVVQPVIEKETHDRHRVHTNIPIHHVTHAAPIVHDSVQHEALSKEDFLGRGGDLTSQISHDQAGAKALADHGCDRHVDGPGETLIAKLGLK